MSPYDLGVLEVTEEIHDKVDTLVRNSAHLTARAEYGGYGAFRLNELQRRLPGMTFEQLTECKIALVRLLIDCMYVEERRAWKLATQRFADCVPTR